MGSLANTLAGLGSTQNIVLSEVSAGTPVAISAIAGTALTVPIIGAVVAGVTILIGAWLNSIAKHNAEKTATTQIVNQAEPYLKQNVAAFLSLPSPTQSEQAQALQNFDDIWAQVVKACGSGQYEDAGQRCIGDRSAGGQWDWFAYYRDPIATANNVVPNPAASIAGAGALLSNVFSGLASGAGGLLLPALLIGALVLVSSD